MKLKPSTAALLRQDQLKFVEYAFRECHPGKQLDTSGYIGFLMARLRPLCKGEPGQLALSLPPQHLKSFLFGACLTSHEMMLRPSSRVLVIAGVESLAQSILKSIQTIMDSSWFQDACNTRLKTRTKNKLTTNAGGVVRAVSITGHITGHPADLIIVDDPVNISDAAKPHVFEKRNEIFDNTIMARRSYPEQARVVVIAHRLHENDLPGHLLAAGDWEYVCLPMVATKDETHYFGGYRWDRKKGELLRPGHFSEKRLASLRKSLGSLGFETLYQQNASGRVFEQIFEDDFRYVATRRDPDLPVVMSIDPAQSIEDGSSFTVIQVWQQRGDQHVLLHTRRKRMDYDRFKTEILTTCSMFRPDVILIEKNADARSFASILRARNYHVELISVGSVDKQTRFQAFAAWVREGRVYLYDKMFGAGSFIAELTKFPYGEYDDQVDACSIYANWMSNNVVPPSRPREVGLVVGVAAQHHTYEHVDGANGRAIAARVGSPMFDPRKHFK